MSLFFGLCLIHSECIHETLKCHVTSCIRLIMYAISPELLHIAGCGSSPSVLLGPTGSFGISEDQYKDGMTCGWTILVEATKVSNVILNAKQTIHMINVNQSLYLKQMYEDIKEHKEMRNGGNLSVNTVC